MRRERVAARRRRRAFTLLEVLMVVVIIGILAAVVVPNFFGAAEGAKEDLTRSMIDTGISGTLDMYRMHMGRYPTSDEGLLGLVEAPDDEEIGAKWRGPYVTDGTKLRDKWGNELNYESPGQYNETTYDLSSPGQDGQFGTDDDITNWEKTG